VQLYLSSTFENTDVREYILSLVKV